MAIQLTIRSSSAIATAALEHALASLPVYRTYVDPRSRARRRRGSSASIEAARMDPDDRRRCCCSSDAAPPGFVTRFQQTTPAIMAKGVEDTAFYRYGRLLALNDVGGDPSRFGIDVAAFHAGMRRARRALPAEPADHDDPRRQALGRRARPDRRARRRCRTSGQTHVDALVRADRRSRAPRTARPTTSSATSCSRRWSAPGRSSPSGSRTTWRRRCARPSATRTGSSRTTTGRRRSSASAARCTTTAAFLDDFEPFVARVAADGERAALGQLVLKLTAPGVPDIYQGDELPFRALVDPDNRRPVDFGWRQAMLRRLMGGSPAVARDPQAVPDPPPARAARAPAGAVRRRLRAARRRAEHLRVPARRRRARGRGAARSRPSRAR